MTASGSGHPSDPEPELTGRERRAERRRLRGVRALRRRQIADAKNGKNRVKGTNRKKAKKGK